MTLLMGAAVAIGVTYACVAPWFLCYPNTNEEDTQIHNSQESDNDVSSANQTLTSTNIRITGLRGLNFVSVTIPNHPAFTRMSNRSLEASSNLRSISNQISNGEHITADDYPVNTHDDVTQQQTIPTIHISSASTDTTPYPLSSNASLHLLNADKSSKIRRINSTDSNNSPCDVIRWNDVNDECFRRMQIHPKIRKPPRAHPPNSRLSQNSSVHQQDSSSSLNILSNGAKRKMQRKNIIDDKKSSGNCVFEGKLNSINSSGTSSIIVRDTLSCDEIKNHSLYPDVVVRRNSSFTTVPSCSDDYQKSVDIIERQDLISEYSTSNPEKIDLNSCLVDKSSSCVDKLEIISKKSTNKSSIRKFFHNKCKKIWMNVNRNNNCENSLKSKCSIESIGKNIPAGHSTFNDNSHLPGEVQGHLNEFKCKSKIIQGHCVDCHVKNMNMTNVTSNMYKKHFNSRGIPSLYERNFPETIKINNSSSTYSNTSSFQEEITNHRSLSCRKNIEYNDDEPLDLSIKSKVYQRDYNNRENISNNIDNNCMSETTSSKQRNYIFSNSFNKKFFKIQKCRSFSDRNQTNILANISRLCYRSRENKNETTNANIDDSTCYPELNSMKNTRHIFTSGFITN